jgi:hypothetical protein
MLMGIEQAQAKGFRRTLYWLALTGFPALWAYLRFQLGLPGHVDALVLIALLAEASLVLCHQPAR